MKAVICIHGNKLREWDLTLPEATVFSWLYEVPSWADSCIFSNTTWFSASRFKALSDLPYITDKADTMYRHYKSLEKVGLITCLKVNNFDYIQITDKGKTWKDVVSEKNPSPGKKSEGPDNDKNLENFDHKSEENYVTQNYDNFKNPELNLCQETHSEKNPTDKEYNVYIESKDSIKNKEVIRDTNVSMQSDFACENSNPFSPPADNLSATSQQAPPPPDASLYAPTGDFVLPDDAILEIKGVGKHVEPKEFVERKESQERYFELKKEISVEYCSVAEKLFKQKGIHYLRKFDLVKKNIISYLEIDGQVPTESLLIELLKKAHETMPNIYEYRNSFSVENMITSFDKVISYWEMEKRNNKPTPTQTPQPTSPESLVQTDPTADPNRIHPAIKTWKEQNGPDDHGPSWDHYVKTAKEQYRMYTKTDYVGEISH